MAAARRDMREVELVESDAEYAPAGAVGDGASASVADAGEPGVSRHQVRDAAGIRAGRISRRWWLVAAGLALVAVGSSVVSQARENARIAALADVPGILAPLDGPVRELWRTDSTGIGGLTKVGDIVIGLDFGADGAADLIGLDPGTGEEVWRTAASGSSSGNGQLNCAIPEEARARGGDRPPPVVACVVVDETETRFEEAFEMETVPTRAHILAVDAASGAVLANRPTEPTTAVAALGEEFVLSHIDADGRVQVSCSDALGTAPRWTFSSEDPVNALAAGQPAAWVTVIEDLVIVNAMNAYGAAGEQLGGSQWVLSADGALVRELTADASSGFTGWIDVQPGGTHFTAAATDSDGRSATDVVDVATGESFTADAFPLFVRPNDSSLADLIVMTPRGGNDLAAYDLTSGRPLWTVPPSAGAGGMDSGTALIVSGRIVRASSTVLTAIDGRTGDTVWSTPLPEPSALATASGWGSELVSDGRVAVLARREDDGGGLVLTAYGLDDGRERWSSTFDEGLNLTVSGGSLFAWSDQGLVALG